MSGTVREGGKDGSEHPSRGVPYLVLALECDRPTSGGARYSLERVQAVSIGRGDARGATRREERGLLFLDVRVPAPAISTSHARLLRTGTDWVVEDLGSTNGTFVNGTRVTRASVHEGDAITIGRTLFTFVPSRLTASDQTEDVDAGAWTLDRGHMTLDPELQAQLDALGRLARSEISILIHGETGVGKELLARSVHEASGRKGAFVAVNCGALPPGLVESQLFGHVKGAFSGAVRDEPGLFRAADRGTLFLDEIGDLPLPSQVALLRALQEREVVPVGGSKPLGVDLRVVAATHQPLTEMVEEGRFRRDLLARLLGFTIELPPLRARRMDFGIIVATLVRRLARAEADRVRFTPAAAVALLGHDWPLNTRELEQCLAGALVLAGDEPIQISHLPPSITQPRKEARIEADEGAGHLSQRDARIRLELLEQLAQHHGNLAEVARAMGKARMQVHRWCRRFGIDPNVYRE